MPRQLIKRGHRLVFSNGIIFLAGTSIVLVIATGAKVDRLIPLYAIGVFTSFTLSQAGMAKHHLREKEPGWRTGMFINGLGAVLTLVVDIVIGYTPATAWVIIVSSPSWSRCSSARPPVRDRGRPARAQRPRSHRCPILRRHVVLSSSTA
jgi:hypothetical protein